MTKWEYLFVVGEFSNHEWVARYINEKELSNWASGPTIYQTSNMLGEEGWEMVNLATTNRPDKPISFRLVFKRPKPEVPTAAG
jgi:hypothetical protein